MDYKAIEVRRNYYLNEWETFSLILDGWTVANNLPPDFTERDVRAYFLGFGREVQFCTPVNYMQGQLAQNA